MTHHTSICILLAATKTKTTMNIQAIENILENNAFFDLEEPLKKHFKSIRFSFEPVAHYLCDNVIFCNERYAEDPIGIVKGIAYGLNQ